METNKILQEKLKKAESESTRGRIRPIGKQLSRTFWSPIFTQYFKIEVESGLSETTLISLIPFSVKLMIIKSRNQYLASVKVKLACENLKPFWSYIRGFCNPTQSFSTFVKFAGSATDLYLALFAIASPAHATPFSRLLEVVCSVCPSWFFLSRVPH